MPPMKAPSAGADSGRSYWRSLDQLADDPSFRRFVENEFPAHADEMLAPASRRSFLKIMGASLAMAGLTACRWPKEEILPFTRRPEDYIPGTPMMFASGFELGGVLSPLLVTSQDGRPIKVDGNPEHPASLGASTARSQASVLQMYDPDRARSVKKGKGDAAVNATWTDLDRFLVARREALGAADGRGFVVLSEASASPTIERLRARMQREMPQASWVEYEPLSRDAERDGTRALFGRPLRAVHHLERARVVVSLDEDFVVEHPDAVRMSREFVAGRDPHHADEHGINRLHVIESCFSLTGSIADRRLPLRAREIPAAAACLAASLVFDHGVSVPDAVRRELQPYRAHALSAKVAPAAADLAAARGEGALLAGPRLPADVHALVHAVNHALGNVGAAIEYIDDPGATRPSHVAAIGELAAAIGSGTVDTLVILGGNPAFDAPADLDFAALLERVPHSVHLALFRNETSALCDWSAPRAHDLESWGDGRDWSGRVGLVQPLIEPLFGGRTPAELLVAALDRPARGYDLVRETAAELVPGEFESAWRNALHDGWIEDSRPAPVALAPSGWGWAAGLAGLAAEADAAGLDLVFMESPALHDGRFANNGWLQELPDPMTKLTWDNAALVSPATAERLGLSQEQLIEVAHDGRSVTLPVYVMPGQAPDTIGVQLGYGRRRAGNVGDGVGVDVYPLRTTAAPRVAPVTVAAAAGSYPLSTTQNHYAMDTRGAQVTEERSHELIREYEAGELAALYAGHEAGAHHADEASHAEPGHGDNGSAALPMAGAAAAAGDHGEDAGHAGAHEAPLWSEPQPYDGYKWGMAIDLNSCTGCNACIVACQAENNIPVVGKDEVGRGREMHWLRVDRYFQGEPDDPGVAHQPLTCHHCENAPCEQVCPVGATMHDDEGINTMVYNRCVGTRYCQNNCPYKVRRFNYFNNHKDESPLEVMIYNPKVTVRMRGVMEKCTYCHHRIAAAKIDAKNDRRDVRDGEITTACEQACPTRAITFGNLNDETSRVAKAQHDARAYALLEFLWVRPRTKYLARVRNRGDHDGADHGAS